jgi:hypothetical protein
MRAGTVREGGAEMIGEHQHRAGEAQQVDQDDGLAAAPPHEEAYRRTGLRARNLGEYSRRLTRCFDVQCSCRCGDTALQRQRVFGDGWAVRRSGDAIPVPKNISLMQLRTIFKNSL